MLTVSSYPNRTSPVLRGKWVLTNILGTPPSQPAPEPTDDRFWSAVRALPQRERAAVALHYLEDLPITEVAEAILSAENK